jgi:hypothetical protein
MFNIYHQNISIECLASHFPRKVCTQFFSAQPTAYERDSAVEEMGVTQNDMDYAAARYFVIDDSLVRYILK